MARNRTGVRVTVYLPDALREQARKAGLNLSRILRDGVERDLRGEGDEPRPVAGASVSVRAAPGGTEYVLFVPEAGRTGRRR